MREIKNDASIGTFFLLSKYRMCYVNATGENALDSHYIDFSLTPDT